MLSFEEAAFVCFVLEEALPGNDSIGATRGSVGPSWVDGKARGAMRVSPSPPHLLHRRSHTYAQHRATLASFGMVWVMHPPSLSLLHPSAIESFPAFETPSAPTVSFDACCCVRGVVVVVAVVVTVACWCEVLL